MLNFNNREKLDKISNYLARYVFNFINKPKCYRDWANGFDLDNFFPEDENKFVYNFLNTYCEEYSANSRNNIFIDESVENCEYINRLVLSISYKNDNEFSLSAMTSINHSNVMCIFCEIPNNNTNKWADDFYLRLVSAIRHELQHSYQSMFLSGTALAEVNYELLRLSKSRIRNRVQVSEKIYLIDIKIEKEARIKQWKLMSKKTNKNWQEFMNDKFYKIEQSLIEDFKVNRKEAKLLLSQAKQSHLEFDDAYGKYATYLHVYN